MNIALIFAGGVGSRMNAKAKPKQFLELHGKPIIIYTIEIFEKHKDIDSIVIACNSDWINYLNKLILKFNITKVAKIVVGGATGQESIYNGLSTIECLFPINSIVLIHDGVRPLINGNTISDNIESVLKHGSAITIAPTTETFIIIDDNQTIIDIPNRANSKLARAPQSFFLNEILDAHRISIKKGQFNYIDSCSMMKQFGKKLALVEGPSENIKITTPNDFFILRALIDAKENMQIF